LEGAAGLTLEACAQLSTDLTDLMNLMNLMKGELMQIGIVLVRPSESFENSLLIRVVFLRTIEHHQNEL
jgi:hypothetical protein